MPTGHAREGNIGTESPNSSAKPVTISSFYVLESRNSFQQVAIGTAVLLSNIFLLTTVLTLGYQWRVAQYAAAGVAPPDWSDWKSLLVDGCKALIILVFASILWISLLYAGLRYQTSISPTTTAGTFSSLTEAFHTLILATLLTLYGTPAVLFTAAAEGSIRKGFSQDTLVAYFSLNYLSAWIRYMLRLSIIPVTFMILSWIPLIGILATTAISFISISGATATFANRFSNKIRPPIGMSLE
jgi:hypothetical protein